MTLKQSLLKWWRGGDEKFTVACDYSMWRGADTSPDGMSREKLYRVVGRKTARRLAATWITDHDAGQARVFNGWHYWPDEKKL